MLTVLEPEAMYPDTSVEQEVLGRNVRILHGGAPHDRDLSLLSDDVCAEVDGLFIFRHWLRAADIARFPKLKVVVRMGVGYDRLDRKTLAERQVRVCNVPDYGTMEVADHAIALALSLRRGIILHHDAQRRGAPWRYIDSPVIQRPQTRTFGIVGLGRIGTAAALRARAFGWRVVFFDPYLPNGVDRALGIERARSLHDLLRQSDTLSLHTPQTPGTIGMIGAAELALLPAGALVVNTSRGPVMDIEALYDAMKDGQVAGAGLDVVPVEPPALPLPRLMAAYNERAPWLEGRLVITPHSAFHTPEAWADIRRKSAETMRDVLVDGLRTNIIPPEGD
ncbi:C-terminal binding protein [Humitalea sp. 24SJ18S-53]|uniref:C-terminal binding protein n=1 Tax=Humitalea sp. 24SJ18S-53 TaxID=3422307 RepID=UPI003D6734A4